MEEREWVVGCIEHAIRAAVGRVRNRAAFWIVLAFALLLPFGAHRCQTAPERDAIENARLNAASEVIFRWHETGHFEFARTPTGSTTVSICVPAAEWAALTQPQRAAVYQLLHQVVWRGRAVDRCFIHDECGAIMASG